MCLHAEKFDTPLHSASKTGFYKADVDSRHGKRRDSDDGRDAFQQQQRQPETIANAPFLKVKAKSFLLCFMSSGLWFNV